METAATMKWPVMVAGAVAAGVIWSLLAVLLRSARREYKREAAKLADLNALPMAEAEQRAMRAMSDESLFRVVAATVDQPVHAVPEGVRELFRRYDRIEALREPAIRLDRRVVTASTTHPGYTVIGAGMVETDVEFEIVCEPGSERVYEAHPDEPPSPYTSIYHLILDAVSEMTQSQASSPSCGLP